MNNFLLWIGALLTLCLGALFAVPHFVDWNGYRGVIEEEASRFLGRRVRVGGEVNLRILPVPYVSFDKLSVADTSAASSGPIFRAENFKLWLSVPPLLQGIVEAHQIELRRPVVELTVQDDGSGNWQDLSLKTGSLSFMPVGFALETLDIIDGEVVLNRGGTTPLTRFEKINGSLSAPALSGPYKFNGAFQWRGIDRSLRLATGRPASNGDVQLKASLANVGTKRTALLDGILSTKSGRPEFSGSVTAKLKNIAAFAEKSKDLSDRSRATAKDQSFEFRSKLALNTQSVTLDAINLALETDGPPQIMTGDAAVSWADGVALKVDLNSRWIDFDRFTVSSGEAAPFDNARQLLVALGRTLPDAADTNVKIAFDQATLGGQALGAIQLVAVRKSGPLNVQEFEANVPGGGKVALSGALAISDAEPGFRGRLTAEGNSLARFLTWGLGSGTFTQDLRDGAFEIESDLVLSESGFSLSNAQLDFGDGPLTGGLTMQLAAPQAITVDLRGHQIDWGRLSPDPFGVQLVRALRAKTGAGRDKKDDAGEGARETEADTPLETQGVKSFAGLARRADLDVTIQAAKLVVGDDVYHDFDGRLVTKAGSITVPSLSFRKDSGLEVELSGMSAPPDKKIDDNSTPARGSVKGLVAARSQVAIAELLQFLGVENFDPVLRHRLSALAPLRIAHVYDFGAAASSPATLNLDGMARGGRVSAQLHFSKGIEDWRSNTLRISGEIENASTTRLLGAMSDSRILARGRTPEANPGRLHFHGEGVPAAGVLTRAVLNANDLSLNYYGEFSLREGDPLGLAGRVTLDTSQLGRELFAVLGIDLGTSLAGSSLVGDFDVVRKNATARLRARNVRVNGAQIKGLVTLTEQTNGPTKVVADLDVDQATLPGVMKIVLAPEPIKASEGPKPVDAVPDVGVRKVAFAPAPATAPPEKPQQLLIWPTPNFELTPLANIEGYVKANFKKLSLSPDGGLTLTNAKMDVGLRPNEVHLNSLTGEALGGTATAQAKVKKATAGVDLDGTLKMQIGTAPAPKTTKGKDGDGALVQRHAAVFELSFAARGFSPRGLASDLDGKGELVLADASLTGLTAKEVRKAASDALKTEGPVDSAAFVANLKTLLKQGEIKLGSLKIPVALKDGILSMSPIELTGEDGKTTFESRLRVASMQFDSEWQIAAKPPAEENLDATQKTLPPIKVRYVGDLAALATVDPELSTGALERELAVQKMERDVAELERLRKLDEARAKEEEDRRRKLEARLAEQRRLQAERELKLLLEQQRARQLGPDGLPLPNTGEPNGAQLPPDGQSVEAQNPPPKPRRVRKKRPPPKKDVWNPFQITPY